MILMKNLIKIFENLCYRNQAVDVFRDLLTITLSQFCPKPHYEAEHKEAVSRLNDSNKINEFVKELINEYHSGIIMRGWCDPWGDLYMEISGRYKSSAMGQYFTPPDICTMMARMMIKPETAKKRISDPACGSGRMALAAKSIAPDNFFFAEDLDPICSQMTAVNFAAHGCIGEVIQHDTLCDPKGMVQGFAIKNIGLPIPAIIPIEKEDSFICSGKVWFECSHDRLFDSVKKLEKEPEIEINQEIKEEKSIKISVEQLSLF